VGRACASMLSFPWPAKAKTGRRGPDGDNLGKATQVSSLEANGHQLVPFEGSKSCAGTMLYRAACVVSCQPQQRDEVVAIAKVLGHGVAVPLDSNADKDDIWKAVLGANLERVGACDNWLVICGRGGQSDLSNMQQMELDYLQKLLEHRTGNAHAYSGGRMLSYVTLDEYRAEQIRYVEALEDELARVKDKEGDLGTWTPCYLNVKGCQYLKSFNGRYKLCNGPHHGRNFYIQEFPDAFGRRASIYFWDDRDGDDQCGWWLGFELTNGRVFAAYNPDRSSNSPPNSNWSVRNWTGWVQEPQLRITAST